MQLTSATDRAGLAEEQAALRRVATLVAEQPSPQEVFTAVTEAVGPLLGADLAAMHVFPGDGTATTIAAWSGAGQMLPIGTHLPLDGDSVAARIFQTGQPARIDSFVGVEGETADVARGLHLRSAVGAPIIVRGRLWGALTAATRGEELFPEDAESRIEVFTELVATAISNAEARRELEQVAAEQQALRRAATLVASGASQMEVFAAITASASELFDVPFASLLRYGPDETATMVAGCAACNAYVGQTWTVPADDPGIVRTVVRSCRPERIEDHSGVHGPVGEAARALGIGSVVGVPVIVDGSVWGVLAVGAAQDGPPLPADAGDRLVGFTELVTTTLINAETRQGLRHLADEQAALRRVATLVARGLRPDEIFAAVSDEVGKLFDGEVAIARFEPDGSAMVVVGLSESIPVVSIGTRWPLEEFLASTKVYRTGRPARNDHTGHQTASGVVADSLRAMSFVSTVAAPIVVEGDLWGVVTVSDRRTSLPPDTEERVEKFTELVGTAIANAQSRGELTASEARARELAEEQAALRRVATLVAGGSSPEDVFWAVIEEVRGVLSCDAASLLRYHDDYSRTELADTDFELVGERAPLGGYNGATLVFETGRPVRIDDYRQDATGPSADHAHQSGWRSCVAVPLKVEGRLWGVVMAASKTEKPLPPEAEERLAKFTELVATAIANAESRSELAASEARAHELAREQAALRRVATVVAEGATADELFSAVAREVAELFDVPAISMVRFEADGSSIQVGPWGDQNPFALGARFEPRQGVMGLVWDSGRPARIDTYEGLAGPVAEALVAAGVRSSIGAPIVVDGRTWGGVAALSTSPEPLPPGAEDRLASFTDLVATAIANSQAREHLAQLADEQAALRRVATLVAEGATPSRVFDAVRDEIARMFDLPNTILMRFDADGMATMVATHADSIRPVGSRWSLVENDTSSVAQVFRTGRAAHTPDLTLQAHGPLSEAARREGVRYGVGVPVVVDGALWGAVSVASPGPTQPPAELERRLSQFTDLLATAIANAGSRAALADSEARKSAILEWALDCIITIDHEGKILEFNPAAEATFGYRREEVLGKEMAELIIPPSLREQHYRGLERYLETGEGPVLRKRVELEGLRWDGTEFPVELTITPITVADLPMFTAYMRDVTDRKRGEEERARLLRGERAARAEAEAASERAQDLAREQAALRRVATLVAEAAKAEEVFSAVAREVGRVLGVHVVTVDRYESDGTSVFSVVLASLGEPTFPVGSRWPMDGPSVRASIYETGRPARLQDWSGLDSTVAAAVRNSRWRWALGVPIVVDGAVWGNILVGTTGDEPIPDGAEERLARFTELVSTSVSNATMRGELTASEARARKLADEQAALRRVATLVAEGATPNGVFDAVRHEVERMFEIPNTILMRYDADGMATLLATHGDYLGPIGVRWPLEDDNSAVARVYETGRPARADFTTGAQGPLAQAARSGGTLYPVAVPVVVEGGLWGAMSVGSPGPAPPPADLEGRLAKFTELVATAIANAESRTELLASRARVVSAADETRRRLERDLHDGIQQWLVALALRARKAAGLSAAGQSPVHELSGLADDLVAVTDELREISRGIHPAILSDAGLDDALAALARRSAIRVELDVSFQGRYDPTLEATVYYVVAESITNAVKHAQASTVGVRGGLRDGAIELEIEDNGVGGADPHRGTGLIGLKDRVDTLGGTISFASPAGAGTTIRVRLPAGLTDEREYGAPGSG